MSSYGRNFDFRVTPFQGRRGARFMLGGSTDIPIGAPVKYNGAGDTSAYGDGVVGVSLVTGAQAPRPAISGIAVYEHAPNAFAGYDPALTTYSDIDTVPHGKLCQVVNGDTTKVVFINTVQRSFLHQRTYTGRIMVAGIGGATSGDAETGSLLSPGAGTDADGYWQTTGTAANGWLVVTSVNGTNLEVEAKMLF